MQQRKESESTGRVGDDDQTCADEKLESARLFFASSRYFAWNAAFHEYRALNDPETNAANVETGDDALVFVRSMRDTMIRVLGVLDDIRFIFPRLSGIRLPFNDDDDDYDEKHKDYCSDFAVMPSELVSVVRQSPPQPPPGDNMDHYSYFPGDPEQWTQFLYVFGILRQLGVCARRFFEQIESSFVRSERLGTEETVRQFDALVSEKIVRRDSVIGRCHIVGALLGNSRLFGAPVSHNNFVDLFVLRLKMLAYMVFSLPIDIDLGLVNLDHDLFPVARIELPTDDENGKHDLCTMLFACFKAGAKFSLRPIFDVDDPDDNANTPAADPMNDGIGMSLSLQWESHRELARDFERIHESAFAPPEIAQLIPPERLYTFFPDVEHRFVARLFVEFGQFFARKFVDAIAPLCAQMELVSHEQVKAFFWTQISQLPSWIADFLGKIKRTPSDPPECKLSIDAARFRHVFLLGYYRLGLLYSQNPHSPFSDELQIVNVKQMASFYFSSDDNASQRKPTLFEYRTEFAYW